MRWPAARRRSIPAGNYFPTVDQFDAAFVNAAEGNFALVPGSPFRNAASDGGALGADLATLNAVASGDSSSAPSPPPVSDLRRTPAPRPTRLRSSRFGEPRSERAVVRDGRFTNRTNLKSHRNVPTNG